MLNHVYNVILNTATQKRLPITNITNQQRKGSSFDASNNLVNTTNYKKRRKELTLAVLLALSSSQVTAETNKNIDNKVLVKASSGITNVSNVGSIHSPAPSLPDPIQGAINALTLIVDGKGQVKPSQTITDDNEQKPPTAVSVADAINAVGFTAKAGGENSSLIKAGDALEFEGGSDGNIDVSINQSSNAVIIALKDELAVKKLSAGDTVIKDQSITINDSETNPAKTISLTDTGLNNGGQTITNVSAGSDDSDAVNVKQLKEVEEKLKSQSKSVEEVKAGDGITVISKGGTAKNKEFTVAVAVDNTTTEINASGEVAVKDEIAIKQLSTGNTVIKDESITINNSETDPAKTISLTDTGLNNGGQTITNVAAGVKSSDAVNKGQLDALKIDIKDIKAQKQSVESVKAGNGITVTSDKNKTEDKEFTVSVAVDNTTTKINKKGEVAVKDKIALTEISTGDTVIKDQSIIVNNSETNPTKIIALTDSGLNNGGQTITNVAAGTAPTDAVNVQQLKDSRDNIKAHVDDLENKLSGGIASVAAIEKAPYVPGKWSYAVGSAYYNGETAFGTELRRTADNGRRSTTAGISTSTDGEAIIRIGITGIID